MGLAVRIAVDAMGGDKGLSMTADAVLLALKKHKQLEILFFGPAKLLGLKTRHFPKKIKQRLVVCNAPESVGMADTRAEALQKTASSMRLAIEAVVAGRADAFVTAGNTAAVTMLCDMLVPKCKGVTRTAFISEIPTVAKPTFMLDLGAHLEATAQDLVEFAFLGHYCTKVLTRYRYPKVALLNVGKEEEKGLTAVRQAHKYLKRTPLNYHGFIEGNELFCNEVDVIVCDGKTGNISLKTAEGTADLMVRRLKETLLSSVVTKAMSITALPLLKMLHTELDPSQYDGAVLVGLTKVIAKSHGASDAKGFAHCIDTCIQSSTYNLAEKIEVGFKKHHLQDLKTKLANY